MELVYIYIQKYEIYKNIAFSFTDRYSINLEDKVLNFKSLDRDWKKGFWREGVSNLSVIVGDNGAGKTMLMRCIKDCLTTGEGNDLIDCLLVFWDEAYQTPRLLKIGSYFKEVKLAFQSPTRFGLTNEYLSDDKKQVKEALKIHKTIFVNNVLSDCDYGSKETPNYHDLSLGGLIRSDFKNNYENRQIALADNMLHNYFASEVWRQLMFINGYKGFKAALPFKLPSKLSVNFRAIENSLKETSKDLSREVESKYVSESYPPEKERFQKEIDKLIYCIHDKAPQMNTSGKMKWIYYMVDNIFHNALRELTVGATVPDSRLKELDCLIYAYREVDKDQEILSYAIALLRVTEKKLSERGSLYTAWLKPHIVFLEWIRKKYKIIDFDFVKLEVPLFYTPGFDIYIEEAFINSFQEFLNYYRNTCGSNNYLEFSWGLSTGEMHLLSLYSRFFSILETDTEYSQHDSSKEKSKSLLILLDEVESSYHPQWQRDFIDNLLNFVTSIFKSCSVQIIITTHSPILLSDVPKGNTIYIRKGSHCGEQSHAETFGQNIYSLYNDVFYFNVSNQDYLMGQFAHKKIEWVKTELDRLANPEENLESEKNSHIIEEIEHIIDLVGEPIIKNIMKERYRLVVSRIRKDESNELSDLKSSYDALSLEDRKRLIAYIIQNEN